MSSSSSHSKRGYRLCDQCGAVEGPGAKFQLCRGCMTTQYCSQDCQKHHWPTHKPICQHTTSQLHSLQSSSTPADENLTKNLRKFTSSNTTLLSWAGYQALRVPLSPSSIRSHAFLIELSPSSSAKSKFSVTQTHIVPLSYVRDTLVITDIQLGAMVVLIQCGPVSQVMPVEVDRPETVGWGLKGREEWEEWEGVLRKWVEPGKGDFRGY